jgi:hypothetical protein
MAYGNPHRKMKDGEKDEDDQPMHRPSGDDFSQSSRTYLGEKSPGITKPGPVLHGDRVKRGRRISKRRKANDAAMALSKSMERTLKEYAR